MEVDGEPAATMASETQSLEPATASSNAGAAEAPDTQVKTERALVSALPWDQPILSFLLHGELPQDEAEARQIQRRSAAYAIINRELVRRSVTGMFQRCVESEKGQEILKDIHKGECGHHAASRTLVAKAFRHGFYWPTTLEEAVDMVNKCEGCQRFGAEPHATFSPQNHPLVMAFRRLGVGHGGTIQDRLRRHDSSLGSHR